MRKYVICMFGRYQALLSLSLAVVAAVCLSACGNDGDAAPKLTGQEARDAFANASYTQLTGDVDDVNTFSDVIADGQNVGEVKEHGIINNRITYSVDGEKQFYVTFGNPSEIEDERYACSLTYAYYDMDGACLGYSQERVLFKDDDSWYVTTFLEPDGTMKDYYVEANDSWGHEWAKSGVTVRNMDREQVGTVRLNLTNVVTKSFAIDIDLGEAAEELSEMDRVAIYWRCVNEMTDYYFD